MINNEHFVSLNFLKKENYSGSMQGMRYRLRKQGEKEELKLVVAIWTEPFSYPATAEEQKQYKEFVFNEDGINQAVDWLNEQYEIQRELWDSVNPYK
ncbi:MAG: hypothetical protein ACERKZ_09450 [Lachnotalea sp.]